LHESEEIPLIAARKLAAAVLRIKIADLSLIAPCDTEKFSATIEGD